MRAFNLILLVLYNVYSTVFCGIFQFLEMQFSPPVGPVACLVDPASEEKISLFGPFRTLSSQNWFSTQKPKLPLTQKHVGQWALALILQFFYSWLCSFHLRPIACLVDPASEETNQSDSFSIEEPKVHIDRVHVMMGGSRKNFVYSSEDVTRVYTQLLM